VAGDDLEAAPPPRCGRENGDHHDAPTTLMCRVTVVTTISSNTDDDLVIIPVPVPAAAAMDDYLLLDVDGRRPELDRAHCNIYLHTSSFAIAS